MRDIDLSDIPDVKEKTTPDPPADNINYKTKIKIEETGEIVEVSMDAKQAIKDIDEKIEAYQQLIESE